ncbi:MAG: peptidoglycan-associated lipoprotein Pal [Methylococcaceae bacterium]|nr:MAG: peptidoglycan-associated lipoprotein Pal [Methylococcaceae bacterium]
MVTNKIYLTAAIMALALAGCSSTGDKQDAGAAGANGSSLANTSGYGAGGASSGYGAGGGSGFGRGGSYTAADLDNPNSPLSKRVIYFQYDSAEVMPEYVSIVTAHAEFLAGNPSQRVTVDGHADERGTREYNIALGEQRAKTVANMLKLQGVADSQVQIVSYGEEKPLCMGHDDECWNQNRRAEFAYAGH